MILRLLAVIGAGAIVVFVILAVSTLYVVEGEGTQRMATSSPAVDMRDQLRKAATPAPVKPTVRATEPPPVTETRPPIESATTQSRPGVAATPPTMVEAGESTGSVDHPIPLQPRPTPPAASEAASAEADAPAARKQARRNAEANANAEASDAAPARTNAKRKGAPRCEGYRTFNAQTRTYRGFDGRTHPCPAG